MNRLVGDLLVGRRCRIGSLRPVWPAQRIAPCAAPGSGSRGRQRLADERVRPSLGRRAEREHRAADFWNLGRGRASWSGGTPRRSLTNSPLRDNHALSTIVTTRRLLAPTSDVPPRYEQIASITSFRGRPSTDRRSTPQRSACGQSSHAPAARPTASSTARGPRRTTASRTSLTHAQTCGLAAPPGDCQYRC